MLQEFMSSYPSCLQDGAFLLVEFYICYPSNSCYNAINLRFWLQYYSISKLQSPLSSTDTHLLHLSDSLDDFATWHKLLPFCKWLNWHIRIRSFTADLTLALSMAAKLEILSLSHIGIFSKPTAPYFTTPFCILKSPHILFMFTN
jgi:hypothetical protein